MTHYDVIVLGAGAAGMMCAAEAGKRGKRVVVIDHAGAAGEKIRISGGGRCNFTNLYTTAANFLSDNAHFCKSALARFSSSDFIKRVDAAGIKWHEKTLGQLFCDDNARQIINMLLDDMETGGADLLLETQIQSVDKIPAGFEVATDRGTFTASSLVVATGGLSIPKMGATGFGYDLAQKFGLRITDLRAGLVPLLFDADLLAKTKALSGVAVDPVVVSCAKMSFREALLFTHRGMSGPAILQISSYWQEGMSIKVNLCPDADIFDFLRGERQKRNKAYLRTVLGLKLPARLADMIAADSGHDLPLPDLSDDKLRAVAERIHNWQVTPIGSEGYRTAEVTLGGVDTRDLSSKTMQAVNVDGLYFIGEVVDVTGHLGGHNFQWAWASGFVAGQSV